MNNDAVETAKIPRIRIGNLPLVVFEFIVLKYSNSGFFYLVSQVHLTKPGGLARILLYLIEWIGLANANPKLETEDDMAFELTPLKYALDALEPIIDAQTVDIHFNKHHATYLKNLNIAIEKHPQFFEWTLEKMLGNLEAIPEDIRMAVRNMGGGVYNHNIYWAGMAPGQDGQPVGPLANALLKTFGSFEQFKADFEKASLARFGSGYCWLSKKQDGSLVIHSTANQDSPLQEGLQPVLVVDVWEHAYYLKYQNRRGDYLANWWSLVNWHEADIRFA